MKIAIVTDSSSGIQPHDAKKMDITVIRMPIIVDTKEYIEARDISLDEIIQFMRQEKEVSTAQPNVMATYETFRTLLREYDHVLYLPISKELSGAYSTGVMIANEFKGNVSVVDTRSVSWPLRKMAEKAKELVQQGFDAQEIKNILETQSDMFAALIPEDIHTLKRGGRITPAAAAVANLLKIVPVLKVAEGKIDLMEKVRTNKRALSVGFERVIDVEKYDDYEWAVLDGGGQSELVEALARDLQEVTGCSVTQEKLYPIVLAHTGPGTIAFGRFKKIEV